MDQQTGVVLAEKNAGERLPMASTTKIMTGLLVLEHFHDLATVVAARRDAVGVGEDEIYLAEGEKLTVDQLLRRCSSRARTTPPPTWPTPWPAARRASSPS